MNKKHYTTQEKLSIVMEVIRNSSSVSEVAKKYGINCNILYRWRNNALNAIEKSFSSENKDTNILSYKAEKDRLLKIIGEQALAIDYQKKNFPELCQ